MISKPRRLHPAAIIFYLYKEFKSIIVSLAILFLAIFRNSLMKIVIAISVTAVIVIIYCLLKYFTFSYQLLEHEILVKSGVFVKKVNHVPYDRIQNITTNQWFFLKPFGLEELEIETAGHSEGPEVSLAAVSVKLKNELNMYRKHVNTEDISKNVSRETFLGESYSITWKELLKFSLTSPAFLSGLLVVLAIYGKIQNGISKQVYKLAADEMQHLGIFLMILGLVIVLLIFYVISVFVLIAKYYHFNLVKDNDQFQMKYGLFKTKRTTISMNRVQAVVIKQTLLRRFLKIASVKLVIISNSKKEDTEKDIIIMPVIEMAELDKFLQQFFPHIPVEKVKTYSASKKTYYYDLRNAIIIGAIADIIFAIFTFKIVWLWIAFIVLTIVFVVIPAYLKAKRTTISVLDDNFLYLKNNKLFTKNIYYIPKSSIQLVERRQSIWLKRKLFAHLKISCRSGVGERIIIVKYLPVKLIDEVVRWYK
ncbi:PH domain-containing protein [Companilactobacillus baiquanensis]|uniref:PH domain-containing protein n=1 Tax=Companilactobacillus baiquanensis TaxID=2486005 RepID=A0ABW1US44_9LACO|nr:PH domain-containing protein [Companilactobacillus baiquanensis]